MSFVFYFPVTNLDVLTAASQTYGNIAAANVVIVKITAIGKVEYTDACKGKIDEAQNAYNALTNAQKALVTNLNVLTAASQTYGNIAAANVVIVKITAIGKVEYTDVCKGRIDDATNAYDALTDDQKPFVSNFDVLTTAKQTYENLKTAIDEFIATFEGYKSEQKANIEALGREDDSDAVKDIISKGIYDVDASEYNVAISLDDNKAEILSLVNSVNEAVENQRAEDQKTTGINELQITNDELPVYDLNGKKITRSMLKSGLYIRNGKKLVVK